jgi:hypothetical protein
VSSCITISTFFFKNKLKQSLTFVNFIYLKQKKGHNLLRERICPEKRQERLNAIRNQTFVCSVDKCDREFEFKQRAEFASHSLLAHCLVLRQLVPNSRPQFKNLDNFTLTPTPITKKAIKHFLNSSPSRANYFRKLARNPTRRTADFISIKNALYNSNSKNNSLCTLTNDDDFEFSNLPKRQLNQICARPMTPLSPSTTTTTTTTISYIPLLTLHMKLYLVPQSPMIACLT